MASQSQNKKAVQEPDFLNSSLGHNELIKKLKIVTETLEGYGDEEEEIEKGKSETGNLASSLGEDWLVQHKNKDVRLLVACALADILRIYAPNPPYLEETNAEVIRLFIKILRGFESPDMTTQHPSYSIHFYLLERLSSISIFSIIPELVTFRDALMLELTGAVYSIVGSMPTHSSTAKVMEHLTSILCSVIEEMESHDIQLLDLVVGALCQNEKRDNANGYNTMKTVIASCENHFQPFLGRELEKIKAGIQTESDLSQGDRLPQAVFELSAIAPRVLTQVLPAYMEDLTMEEPASRIKAIKLLGAIFSVGTFSADFSQVFTEFKRRTSDKDADVRKAVVSVCHHLVAKRPELARSLMQDSWVVMGESREAPMCLLVVDADEGVRSEAVKAVLDLCQHNSDAVPPAFLQHVAERTMDKKAEVRHAAIQGLANLWQTYCAPFDMSELTKAQVEKFGWIPSKMVSLVNVSQDSKAFAINCLEETCLAAQVSIRLWRQRCQIRVQLLSDIFGDSGAVFVGKSDVRQAGRSSAEIAVDFYNSLDAKGRENLETILRARVAFQESFVKLCKLRTDSSLDIGDDDGASADQTENLLLNKLSAAFLDPQKAHSEFGKLAQVKVAKLWETLESALTKPRDEAGMKKLQDDVLKRLGPRSPLLDFVKNLIRRLVDTCFGLDFVRHVLQGMMDDEEEEFAKAKPGLPLVAQLAGLNKALFAAEEKTLETLILNHAEKKDVGPHVTKILANTAEVIPKLKGNRALIKKLQELALSESWVVAKFAVRSVVSLGEKKNLQDLVKNCLSALSFGNQLPAVLRVMAEVAKAQPALLGEQHETVVKFVIKRLLQGPWPQSAGKKDRNVVQDSKVQGMKLLATLLLHMDVSSALQATMVEIFTDTIQQDGELTKEQGTTKADKALLRLTAGNCILRLTKGKTALCSAEAFATVARLCSDEEQKTQQAFMFKLYKGTARQAGKLPFQFAGMLALVAHDADNTTVEKAKFYLRNVFALMLKLRKQSAKAPLSLLHERMLPYLLFALAVHPSYLDPEDSSSQVGLAFKKYLDLYFNALLTLPAEEQHCSAQLQVIEHIRSCKVPSEAQGDADPKIVERNVGLLTEIAHRILVKAGGTKKGAAGLATSKLVDPSVFRETSLASPPPVPKHGSPGFPMTPAGRAGESPAGTPGSKAASKGGKSTGKKSVASVSMEEGADSDDDGEPCLVCGSCKDAENTILCDGCDGAYHTQCVQLDDIPTGQWFCRKCTGKEKSKKGEEAKKGTEVKKDDEKKRKAEEAEKKKDEVAKKKAEEAKKKAEEVAKKKEAAEAKKAAARSSDASEKETAAKRAVRNLDKVDFPQPEDEPEQEQEQGQAEQEVVVEEEVQRPAKQARKSEPKKKGKAASKEKAPEPEEDNGIEAAEDAAEFGDPCKVCGSNADAANTMLCEGCDDPYHATCVGLAEVPTISWFCKACMKQAGKDDDPPCKVCGSTDDPDSTILCDGCDGAYHTACVGLSVVPSGSWFCSSCVKAKIAGKAVKSPAAATPASVASKGSAKSDKKRARESSDFDFGLSDEEDSMGTHSTTPARGKKSGGGTPQGTPKGGAGKPPKARASSTHEVLAKKSGAAFDKALAEAKGKQPAKKAAPAKKRRL